ncbi:hypothetical protein D3C78_275010 [compost metagenome]
MKINFIQFQTHGDDRGSLISLEQEKIFHSKFSVFITYLILKKVFVVAFMPTKS